MPHQPSSSKHLPTISTSEENLGLHRGITTRVMASKQTKQLQREMSDNNERRNSLPQRRNSRFLSGASIPNSTIRSSLDASASKTKISDEIQPPDSSKNTDDYVDEEQSTEKESWEERGLERMRKKINGDKKHSLQDHLTTISKEPRRSPLKLLDVEIPQKRRQSTLESIKNAIDQSPNTGVQLVNADSMEKQKTSQPPHPITENIQSTAHVTQKVVQKKDLQTQTSLDLKTLILPNDTLIKH